MWWWPTDVGWVVFFRELLTCRRWFTNIGFGRSEVDGNKEKRNKRKKENSNDQWALQIK
jgi:hypothetical protein